MCHVDLRIRKRFLSSSQFTSQPPHLIRFISFFHVLPYHTASFLPPYLPSAIRQFPFAMCHVPFGMLRPVKASRLKNLRESDLYSPSVSPDDANMRLRDANQVFVDLAKRDDLHSV
jgi:hypothetical protein